MNCEELRWYFEDHLRDAEVRSARGAVAEHVATCVDCARFVAEQRELGRSLRAVRESVGPVPEQLDAVVLANFRRSVADQMEARVSFRRRVQLGLAWRWSTVAIGVLAVVMILFFALGRTRTTAKGPSVIKSTDKSQVAERSPELRVIPVTRPIRNRPVRRERAHSFTPIERAATPSVRRSGSLPDGFRSLMYCDDLSCPGDMQMIRVQLPSSALPRQVSNFIQTGGSITADVLVGPDGIARGIRLEEIEF